MLNWFIKKFCKRLYRKRQVLNTLAEYSIGDLYFILLYPNRVLYPDYMTYVTYEYDDRMHFITFHRQELEFLYREGLIEESLPETFPYFTLTMKGLWLKNLIREAIDLYGWRFKITHTEYQWFIDKSERIQSIIMVHNNHHPTP